MAGPPQVVCGSGLAALNTAIVQPAKDATHEDQPPHASILTRQRGVARRAGRASVIATRWSILCAPAATAGGDLWSGRCWRRSRSLSPLGLGGAISPVMVTEQTVLLAGPDGGRAGVRYAAGVVLTTLVIVVAIVPFRRAISLPTEPHLDASLDLVLGLALINVAVLALVSGPRPCGSPSRNGGDDRGASGSRHARAAFAFGVFADGDERHDAGLESQRPRRTGTPTLDK